MRRLLTTLALLCAFGAPAALPAQAAPLGAPLTAPAAFTSYTSTTRVSNATPRQNSTVTVSGTLKSAGKPVAGVPMTSKWRYKTTTSTCTGTTNAQGVASCARSISHATPGYRVVVTLTFSKAGQTLGSATTGFTPR